METYQLGGERAILRVGLGTNRIADDQRSRAILAHAAERGIDFIDTADLYGNGTSERVIGESIDSDAPALIATKGGYHDASPEHIAAAIDASRQRLKRQTIDLYYLHRPHPEIPIEHSVDPIVSAKQDGRVRFIGLSNVTLDQIDRVRRLTPIAAVQNAYNCDDHDQDDVIDYCQRNAIAFVAHSPLRGSSRAKKIAKRIGAPRTTVALAAMLARSPAIVAIPGTLRPQHLDDNLAAFKLQLEAGDLDALGFIRQ